MKTTLTQKYQSLKNLLAYRWAMMRRPHANAAIAKISAQCPTGYPGTILCEGLWDHPHHWLRLAMFRCAAAEKFGSDLIGLYEETSTPAIVDSLRALGLSAEEIIPSSISNDHFSMADEMLQGIDTPQQALGLKFSNEYPAHYFYDGVLKAEKIGQLDCTSPQLRNHLASALKYLDFYESVFTRHEICALVVSHPTTIRFSTLVWTALRHQIPVFVLNYVNKHITIQRLNTAEDFNSGHIDVPTIDHRDTLSEANRVRLIKHGEHFLNASLTGKESQFSMVKVYADGDKAFTSRQAFCEKIGADPSKPINIVMANCWPDFPNGFGPCYYTDYVDWFNITLAAIRDDKTCTWILKPHPAEHLYGQRTTMRQLLDFPLPEGVYIWPESANNTDAMSFANTVVTAIGTAGIEFPAVGIRALTGRVTPYSGWGFTNYADSKESYAHALKTISNLPKPDKRAQDDAKIYFALTNADLIEGKGLFLPWGLFSYRLWAGLSSFISDNHILINQEITCISHWIVSQSCSYHVHRMLTQSDDDQDMDSRA